MKQPCLVKRIIVALLCLCGSTQAREIRTPLLLSQGPQHELYSELNHDCWFINSWVAGYGRSASAAFNRCGNEVSLSTLYFNKSTFNPQEAFSRSTIPTDFFNPLLSTSIIGPQVKYQETGVAWGANLQGFVSECIRIGFRCNLPFRNIKINRIANKGNGTSSLGGQKIDAFLNRVAPTQIQNVSGVPVKTYAYRLDFLSQLPYTCEDNCPGRSINITNYRDPDFPPNNPITISNQDVTNQTGTPVSLLQSTDGSAPDENFAIQQAVAQQLPIENAQGTSDAQRSRFDASVDYTTLSTDRKQQETLFVVPSLQGTQTTAASRVIQQHVNELIPCFDTEAENIFKRCGISFASQCIKGMGDFDTEIFGGYYFSPSLYGEAFAGITWPTGKLSDHPLQVFRQPLGNNGHYEYKLGIQTLWQPNGYAAFKGDLSWHSIQRSSECVATPFFGAQVKNIGRPLTVEIAWDYMLLHADLIFTPLAYTGLQIGYELYHKRPDEIYWFESFATDCVGKRNLIDSRVLSCTTNVTSHKIRAEAFWFCDTFDIFGGGSVVFAGRNAPKERDWHVGIIIYF